MRQTVPYPPIAELAGAEEILVPGVGLKEGLILDLADELTDYVAHSDRREHEIRAASVTLGRRYKFDEAHALQVERLSLALFDQLVALLARYHRRAAPNLRRALGYVPR